MEQKNIFRTDNYFVMSTGRTGTTFLYHFLRRLYPALGCFQEPPPNWFYNLASNLYATGTVGKVQKNLIRGHFLRTRNRLIQAMPGNKYLEVNPFIFGLGYFVKELLGEIKILHITRHPLTYISSVLNYIPSVLYSFPPSWRVGLRERFLWNLNVSKALEDPLIEWSRLSSIERKAWYWGYVNRRIASYRTICSKYLRIKFEDLFSEEKEVWDETLRTLVRFLELPFPGGLDSSELTSRMNESRENRAPRWQEWGQPLRESVLEICRQAMDEFDYLAEPSPATV